MQANIGQKGNSLKMASLVLQPSFVDQFEKLDRIQLRSAIDSVLLADRSIRLTARIWLRLLKMPFVPLAFSKTMILRMLRARSSKLMYSLGKKDRHQMMHRARKEMRRTKIN